MRQIASEQLTLAEPTTLDLSELNGFALRVGLAVCVHNGEVYYVMPQKTKHLMEGEIDRIFSALQVVYQWLQRTRWRGATKCFQHSLRDDQSHSILNVVDGRRDTLGLPAMLWHFCAPLAERTRRACGAPRTGNHFLWPEYDYEGSVTHHQPPTRNFRNKIEQRSALAWQERREHMPYRTGYEALRLSGIRRAVLGCARSVKSLPPERSTPASELFRSVADIDVMDWNWRSENKSQSEMTDVAARFATSRYALWLPGKAGWSTSLNQLMAVGAALFVPANVSDRHSLNSLALLEYCPHSGPSGLRSPAHECLIEFARKPNVCSELMATLERHHHHAEQHTSKLHAFVGSELHPDCVDEYQRIILEGLPQTVQNTSLLEWAQAPCDGGPSDHRRFCRFSGATIERHLKFLEHVSRNGQHVLGMREEYEQWAPAQNQRRGETAQTHRYS